ncbi:MAG: sigma 54-interacting transcriptional regulator, partial [Candidatus Brocadiia bacterium]
LFLDEVSEMSVPLQVKLLRVLETGSFRRVGGVEDIRVDVRAVAATNRDLKSLVDENLFRQDLYYRLNVFPIVLPPLRDRDGDIQPLAEHFLAELRQAGSAAGSLSEEALHLLRAYAWPGNVRELENVIERAVILSGGEEIRPEHLPMELRPGEQPSGPPADASELTFREAKGEFEKHYLETLLEKHDGNVAQASEAANMSRAHFYELIKKHGIDLPSYSKKG